MRIAMFGCKGIPASSAFGGGIEAHVEELASRLAARGHEVTVYVRPYANPDCLSSWHNVRLITLPTIRSKHLDAIVATLLATIHALFQSYDILHYHAVGPSTLAWIPRIFKPRARVIVTFHSQDRFHEKWGRIARAYLAYGEWAAVRFPHATISVSHTIELFCRRKLHAQTVYIPNGVEVPRLNSDTHLLAQFGLEPRRYFFTLSRLVPHKAIEDVLRAFTGLHTDMKLVIIGSAAPSEQSYLETLQQLAASDTRVIFVGRQTDETLDQLITHGYALVHASRSEGLSVAILEAMARGKVVIMSDIAENLELIDHSGFSFRCGDWMELRRTMEWLLADPALVQERGRRGRTFIKRFYAWDAIVQKIEELYRSLL